jgi:hypothetical protein
MRQLGYRGPILALTGNSSEADAEKAMEAGYNSTIVKPIRSNDLVGIIQQWTTPTLAVRRTELSSSSSSSFDISSTSSLSPILEAITPKVKGDSVHRAKSLVISKGLVTQDEEKRSRLKASIKTEPSDVKQKFTPPLPSQMSHSEVILPTVEQFGSAEVQTIFIEGEPMKLKKGKTKSQERMN